MDEVKPSDHSGWAYVCILSVPCHLLKDALKGLEEDREACGYPHEVHFGTIKNKGTKTDLAKRWLSRVMDEHSTWHFTVLGLDTTMLCKEWFGETTRDQIYNPYKRFFRATLHHHLLSAHAKKGPVEVWKVFHDSEGCLEADTHFSWHGIGLIQDRVDGITFMCPEIEFVASDHQNAGEHHKHAHFVQMCDLIVGTVRHCHEAVTPHKGRDHVARHLLPLVERINCPKKSRNVKSSYRHCGRLSLSYFPSRIMTMEELSVPEGLLRGEFYKGRPLALSTKGQSALPL